MTAINADGRSRATMKADVQQSRKSTMTFPIQITFHHMDRSEALEQAINEKAEKLGKFHPGITQLHVAVTSETRHSKKAREYRVRLDLHVKGSEYAITRQADEDAFVAARDAFDTARRLLDSEIDERRGFVKQH
ncbi:MAG TPA: HPF/RaiA family ribosome-associated protein [Burkholderiaceae bacterium]|nr:HPF/RaiA family ribosome-associated protein [Burkholderiaceae bacterium]HQR77226.1 HPF/RaiA family ribosome-associated protein [Burkholderiaceae bacterium]